MSNSQEYKTPKSEQAVNNLLIKISRKLEKKFNLLSSGSSVAMPQGIVSQLGLDFKIEGSLTKEQIRKILIEISQEFLLFINDDEAVRPYLKNYPFEIRNIDIGLFFIDKKGYGLDAPNIAIASINGNEISYWILKRKNGMPTTENRIVETYEEALEALKSD